MKTITRYIMTLALLLTAATGAWAQDKYTVQFKANGNTKTVENITLPHTFVCTWDGEVGRGTGELDVIIQELYGLDGGTCASNIPESDNASVTCDVDDEENIYIIVNAPFNGTATVTGYYFNSSFDSFNYSLEITCAPAEPAGPTVTINDDKTEASFLMPTSDATVDYELVRDMSVQMLAQVGDDPDKQPRYRVKKEDNVFKPADLSPAQVMALFSVNDQIEQKVLTPTTDYIVNIYAIDEEGQPTGNPMTFADFTFEPGIYAVKAVAAEGSPYDGESALSNTFVLFQGYEVYVPAGEYVTYYKDEALYVEDEDAKLYTITTVGNETATATELTVAAANTPLLVKNNAAETKTILLIPTTSATPDEVTPYEGFKGTLEATQIAASTATQNNYALNGKEFVWVMEAIDIAANRAWLEVPAATTNGRALQIVFGDEATGINGVNGVREVNDGSWYDLNGRKLQAAPTKKGVYILNGKKVVVK